MSLATPAAQNETLTVKEIADHCNRYKGADAGRSITQLITTIALFITACALMFYSTGISYALTLLLAVPTAGLLTRLFIFQHDCGHGSFFNDSAANKWTGRALSLLTLTPYDFWRRAHNMHHATSGDLDRRSIGGIDTITVNEYKAMSKRQKLAYRFYRNPLVMLIFGTPFYVVILQRLPVCIHTNFHENYQALPNKSVWKSIMATNLALVLFYGTLTALLGPAILYAVFLPVLVITAWIGGWLFYIQHQFEHTYWQQHENWSAQEAALYSSSCYALPKILQWFTGNIGLHHIHHLCSRIPNYKLQECMDALPGLAAINRLGLRESLGCLKLKLWDEEQGKLIGFGELKTA